MIIDNIIEYTQINRDDNNHLLNDINNLDLQESFEKPIIEKRMSYRNFFDQKSDIGIEFIASLVGIFEEVTSNIKNLENYLDLYILDNNKILGNDKLIYIYDRSENKFKPMNNRPVKEDELFLQEEMHLGNSVVFFVWDKSILINNSKDTYRELMMISALIAHQMSLYGTAQNVLGTVFAGVSPVEFVSLPDVEENKIPVFAYAF